MKQLAVVRADESGSTAASKPETVPAATPSTPVNESATTKRPAKAAPAKKAPAKKAAAKAPAQKAPAKKAPAKKASGKKAGASPDGDGKAADS
ncbi:hypothetical protein [Mycobacterium sp. 050134]|uniref:hypothetical protein n=1 Tax=Mycobacterium sp. 050134 TaxID=3096111 RepID=UPI002EDB7FA5